MKFYLFIMFFQCFFLSRLNFIFLETSKMLKKGKPKSAHKISGKLANQIQTSLQHDPKCRADKNVLNSRFLNNLSL